MDENLENNEVVVPTEGDPVIGTDGDTELPIDEGMTDTSFDPNNPNTKFELTDIIRIYGGKTLYRIRAIKDIPSMGVKLGDLGGWVESVDNLDKDTPAWIYDDAIAMGASWVTSFGSVKNTAIVKDNSSVKGFAVVYGNGVLQDYAVITDRASCAGVIGGVSIVKDGVCVLDGGVLYGMVIAEGNGRILGNISGNVLVKGSMVLGSGVVIEVPEGSYMELEGDMDISSGEKITLRVGSKNG